MNYLLIGISAALGACVLALVLLLALLSRRSGRRADERVDQVVGMLEQRMDELARELAGTMQRAEEETRRSSLLAEIVGSIDLEDVLARPLDAAIALPGADAAIVRLESPGAPPVVAALGIPGGEAERHTLAGPPGGGPANAVELAYRYTREAEGESVRTGLAVPLVDEGAQIGWLALYSREAGRRFGDDDVQRLGQLAHRGAPGGRGAAWLGRLPATGKLTRAQAASAFHQPLGLVGGPAPGCPP